MDKKKNMKSMKMRNLKLYEEYGDGEYDDEDYR